ncbi:hypothetical protein N7462_002823 [Penicillium macrosclerotiorum]|uniref:uncharacterized protein n=1 Tax=Penicillium macrosclerotiorum TaxID=303699 RepID=UPI002548A47B|nr:uncharacterized protein N7462_002823 [Penicillium macrosclerotiorum]KAJ5693400.1 hypothetical protein N7462_002823 [Penicillium macrosclerotiorum]
MSSAILLYLLATATLLSALIVTILNGLAYATLQSLPSYTLAMGLAPVVLSIVTCMSVLVLVLLLHQHVRSNSSWPRWKIGVFYFTGAYLLVAAASVAGTMANNDLASSLAHSQLLIARSIFWAISIITQGLYYGFLLVTLAQRKPCPDWPRSYSHELKSLRDSAEPISPPAQTVCGPFPDLQHFDTRRSSLRKFPRRSNRFSGGTLCLDGTRDAEHHSFDTNSSTRSSLEPSRTQERTPEASFTSLAPERDTRPLLARGNGSFRSMPSLRRPQHIQASLDSLVQRPLSPTASSIQPDSPSSSTFNLVPESNFGSSRDSREHHIHPLFRSTSPCPSPTPTPGTMVKASPSAGQTITVKTLTRMRSARSLRETGMRTPSPFSPVGASDVDQPRTRQEFGSGRSLIHAGHVRRSITQYEKRYDLKEWTEEK